ncbi:MAG: HPr family phosphocarrier protein [Roseiflexaceae bacterium]|nr:HPr family phosphocarrier protein [Roseiflexus sp.]MDW8147489.1 HPr family phosphocarrier protein [Roseiflexaceae bacterium]MCS6941027.1 HPr family phosphocarrier protein [Roseiflexus sp.]MCS7291028.1 HPr family phosphocarrier protein [Roseiflexus sp.]MDW8211928.1 HPr family phosphocarrier protein [Roseiflexaceae bacterium]
MVRIRHPFGLHARPAADFYRKTREFRSRITVRNMSRRSSVELPVSLLNLLQLGAAQGHQVLIRAEGDDEREAVAALAALLDQLTAEE